jgi:hypothetical protein
MGLFSRMIGGSKPDKKTETDKTKTSSDTKDPKGGPAPKNQKSKQKPTKDDPWGFLREDEGERARRADEDAAFYADNSHRFVYNARQ